MVHILIMMLSAYPILAKPSALQTLQANRSMTHQGRLKVLTWLLVMWSHHHSLSVLQAPAAARHISNMLQVEQSIITSRLPRCLETNDVPSLLEY